jgi:hypothetical protein
MNNPSTQGDAQKAQLSFEQETAPLINALEAILQSREVTRAKRVKIKGSVLPEMPELMAKFSADSDAADELAEMVSIGLYMLANHCLQTGQDLTVADEALAVASKLTTSDAGAARVQEAMDLLASKRNQSTCFFCGTEPADPSCARSIYMCGDIKRELGRVDFKRISIAAARCAKCKGHDSAVKRAGLTVWGAGLLIGLGVGWNMGGERPIAAAVIGFFAGFFCDCFISVFCRPVHMKDEDDHPEVKRLKNAGWQLGYRPR